MKNRGKTDPIALLIRLSIILLYHLANFFILVGEATQFIILTVFKLLFFLLQSAVLFAKEATDTVLSLYQHVKKTLSHGTHETIYRLWKAEKLQRTKVTQGAHEGALRLRSAFQSLLAKFPRFKISFKLPRPKARVATPLPRKLRKKRIISVPAPMARVKYFVFGFGASLVILFIYQSYLFVTALPNPGRIGQVNFPLSTHITDRKGRLLYEIYREQNRTKVTLKELPAHVTQATIAIEDKDFFRHNGVSLVSGIGRAIKDTIQTGYLQGGSTITQQLVKSSLLTPERTITRKVKEIILALWAERLYSKDEILELYLNQVPYGGASYGIEEASRNYFGKRARELNLSEAAFLAGLPQSPSKYSPHVSPQLAVSRRNDVLKNMLELKYIDQATYERALKTDLVVIPPQIKIRAPHFVFYSKKLLEEEFGIHMIEEGGLKVTTTLDLSIQEEAERILAEEVEKIRHLNVTNGAILVTRPSTGEVLAMVGSVDYFASPSGSFNVTTALRQPGSAIKPLMYSYAIDTGAYTAATTIDDAPTVFAISGSEAYRPVNYDGKFHGRIPLRYALANSYNVPAVKVLNTIGVQNFVTHARAMGITTWTDSSRFGLSLTLGAGEVTMTDMATSFGVMANRGNKIPATPFLKVEDSNNQTLLELSSRSKRVLKEGTAFIMSDILSDSVARRSAFGPASALEVPGYKVAVKTGTTNDKKDNWTVGYTPEFLVTVWVGNNNNTPMNPTLTSGVTGAAPIWNRVMIYLLKTYGTTGDWYSQSTDVLPRPCYGGRTEFFLTGTEDKAPCRNIVPQPTASARP